jgi:CarboxypepD_reg-like domain
VKMAVKCYKKNIGESPRILCAKQIHMRTILLFALLFSIILPEHIRAQTVSGYVYDAADGESLVGVTVQVSGSGRGASTNKYGFYSLSLGAGNHQLRFSYLG